MSEFELNELALLVSSNINDQFQFWMAATFAVVIASYTAGDRLAMWARVVIAILYAATVVMLYFRYLSALDQVTPAMDQLRELGTVFAESSTVRLVTILRQTVMFGGSLLAIILICVPTIGMRTSGDPEDR